MADRDLVERARAGDHEAFAGLAESEIARLHATARLIIGDREAAQDAVQEALIRAWRDLPSLRDVERFEAWLGRVLVRACYEQIRRQRRRRAVEGLASSAIQTSEEDGAGTAAERDRLMRAFDRIGPEHRAVIVLHLYLGYPLPDVAEVLAIPLGTAKSRLHRGLRALRAALDAGDRATPPLHEAEAS